MTISRATPWLRIFAEGVVIVGSILLAFGVDAWWDGRQDDARGAEYRTALLEEVAANLEHLDRVSAGVQRSIDAAGSIRGWLTGDLSDAVGDSISRRFAEAGGVSILTPITNTYDQLVATGDLRLLSTEVRDALGGWQREVQNVADYWDAYILAFRTQTADPYYLRELGWAELVGLFRSELNDGIVRFPTDWKRLARDRQLDNILTHTLLLNTERLIAYGRLRDALQDLEAALKRDSGDR